MNFYQPVNKNRSHFSIDLCLFLDWANSGHHSEFLLFELGMDLFSVLTELQGIFQIYPINTRKLWLLFSLNLGIEICKNLSWRFLWVNTHFPWLWKIQLSTWSNNRSVMASRYQSWIWRSAIWELRSQIAHLNEAACSLWVVELGQMVLWQLLASRRLILWRCVFGCDRARSLSMTWAIPVFLVVTKLGSLQSGGLRTSVNGDRSASQFTYNSSLLDVNDIDLSPFVQNLQPTLRVVSLIILLWREMSLACRRFIWIDDISTRDRRMRQSRSWAINILILLCVHDIWNVTAEGALPAVRRISWFYFTTAVECATLLVQPSTPRLWVYCLIRVSSLWMGL